MINNYIIEGDIDFFSELNNLKNDKDPVINANDNICLITYEPLSERYIKMICGHTFNYVPLFNDLLNYKQELNKNKKIKICQNKIRCPYCRKITTKLLPCYEGFDEPGITVQLCKEIIKTGPKKGLCCGIKSIENNLCKKHSKIININI